MPALTTFGPHLKGLGDMPIVETDKLLETRVRVAEASLENAVMVVAGPVGLGKTFAVARAVESVATDAGLPAKVTWLELTRTTHHARLLEEIYVSVLGVEPTRQTKPRILFGELAEALESEHRIVVVDEAHNLARPALLELRGFHDRPDSVFALIIVGTPRLDDRISGEMRSRASLRVDFDSLNDDSIVDLLCRYDPIFETADPKRLRRLNMSRAHGEFRWWAKFLLRARRYSQTEDPQGVLTDAVIDDVIASLP